MWVGVFLHVSELQTVDTVVLLLVLCMLRWSEGGVERSRSSRVHLGCTLILRLVVPVVRINRVPVMVRMVHAVLSNNVV